MRRIGNLYWRVAEMDNLELAFWKAQRGKSQRQDVCEFRSNLRINLLQMREELLSGDVPLGKYCYFMIYEPKPRKICAAEFRERVLHHAVVNVCEPVFERQQIFDSYACRIGKGVDKCLSRAMLFCRLFSRFMQCDVHKFFDSIDHRILMSLLARHFKDSRMMDLFNRVISSYEVSEGCGMPIGNLLSQYFANFYLSKLDHEIKERWHVRGYLRYMDDFVLFGDSATRLEELQKLVTDYLSAELRLTLNAVNSNLTSHGIPFLSYEVYPGRLRLSQKAKRRFRDCIPSIVDAHDTDRLLPMLAFVDRARSFGFKRSVFYGGNVKARTV